MAGRAASSILQLRYLGSITCLSDEKAGCFTHLEERNGFALIALEPDRPGEIIAVVLYVRESASDRAEYAALVEDRWQSKGLGLGLTGKLVGIALARGICRFWGILLPENTRMLNLLRNFDLPERIYLKDGLEHVKICLETANGKTGP